MEDIGSPEMYPYVYDQLIYDKGSKAIQQGKEIVLEKQHSHTEKHETGLSHYTKNQLKMD